MIAADNCFASCYFLTLYLGGKQLLSSEILKSQKYFFPTLELTPEISKFPHIKAVKTESRTAKRHQLSVSLF